MSFRGKDTKMIGISIRKKVLTVVQSSDKKNLIRVTLARQTLEYEKKERHNTKKATITMSVGYTHLP